MALSASESALLTQTCENMNIAANTCREVLEMLRNLGNTGVVDIATHNNATSAHANAANLVQKLSNGTLVLGSLGDLGITGYENVYPFYMEKQAGTRSFRVFQRGVHSPGFTQANSYMCSTFFAENDSLLSKSDLHSKYSQYSILVHRQMMSAVTTETTSSNDKIGIDCLLGAYNDQSYNATSIRFGLSSFSGSYNYAYEFNTNALIPYSGQTISLGLANLPFDTAYLRTAATVTSDRREKSGISALGSEAVEFVKALRPVQFTVKNGRQAVTKADDDGNPINIEVTPGTRRHWGLIAQEVKEALSTAGYEDAAVWCLADKDNPDSKQSLRYEELIAPMIKVIQNQQERIEALERKVA